MFDVEVSATFARQFHALPKPTQKRIRAGIEMLRADPFTPRSGADIKQLRATDPTKHRLRVGAHRVVYAIDGKRVRIIEVFARERGYRE